MAWFLLIFIIIDILQTIYIKHLKKEIAFRDSDKAKENLPVVRRKKKNRVLKLIKEIFWFG